ncbi:helix-turn-helix domain-containing protein [Clostridium senegalense]|uniref:helix-turn-helix domain-containing protein n=1 Tax=Clostridium senegalense TaxID=1465809 RepID=UPI001C109727|nr:helix-turn-helix transcriptional regulator [Clostridium senegalense]MBU5227804.1 helix-turn-helix domain-containing protein [Clostridium senegalense]
MNTNEFKAARIRKGYTQEKLSKLLGVTKSSLSRKENGLTPFNCIEVSILKEILKLTPEEIDNIFFNEKVVFKTTKNNTG